MTKFSFALIIMIFYSCSLFAQWTWQNPLPQGNNLNSVYMVNKEIIYAAGKKGMILKSTNAGLTWTILNTGTNSDIIKIYFADQNNGVALGRYINNYFNTDEFLRTTDGGINWSITTHDNFINLTSMFFVNRNDGYITSFYNVFKTTNGGKSWSCYPFTKDQILYDVFFIDSKTGFLTGSKLMKTTNGGFDWFTHSQNWFSKVYFPDPTTGFGISGGKIYKSTDSGVNWFILSNIPYGDYTSFFFLGPAVGYIAGYGGLLITTADGGENWTEIITNPKDMFCSIHFSDSENGTVIGEMGAIYTSTDGGEIWTSQKKGYSDLLTSVWFTSPSIGIAVGDNGTILRTNDYGRNWNLMPSLTSKKINKLFFTDQNNGYAVGDSGTIIKSTNGGADWSLLNSPVHSELRSVLFLDSLNGLVVGDDACLIRTTDKGQNWSVINLGLGYGYMLSSISIKNSQTIYVSGTDATTDIVIKSTDSGISWDLCEDDKISVKYFIDNNNGFGLSGWQVFKTTNGGDNWGMQYQCMLGLYTISMSFPLPETGYILAAYDPLVCGDFQGALLKTTNGGLNWSLALLPNYGSLQSQCFINIDTGYVVGEFGCILKTTDGGISWDYQGKENYTSQNSFKVYPNPSTDFIVFEIMPEYLSKFENIELSIFDMNGRVKLKQFIYKPYYVFNVTDFSQGIYTAKVSFQDGQSDIIKFIVLKK